MSPDKQHLLPDEKMYSLVTLDKWKPPDDGAATKSGETDSLDRETDSPTKGIERIAYDRHGRVYELPRKETDTPVCVSRLSGVDAPEPTSEPEYPEKINTRRAASEILENPEANVLRRRAAIEKLRDEAEENPFMVVEYVPQVVTVLDDEDDNVQEKAAVFIGKMGEEYPEEVKPAVRKLKRMVEEDDNFVAASSAIGKVVKEYPEVGVNFVNTYLELIGDSRTRVRNNALAMLTDIAEEYPEEVDDRIPRYIELLEDDDEYVRYNAVSVLTKIAKKNPEMVSGEVEVDRLTSLLDVIHHPTRENVCWLLGYIGAEEAIPDMEEVKEDATSERLQEAAEASIENARIRGED